MLAGRTQPDDDLTELLYRERFGLSTTQMREEPLEAVEAWMILENVRKRRERRRAN